MTKKEREEAILEKEGVVRKLKEEITKRMGELEKRSSAITYTGGPKLLEDNKSMKTKERAIKNEIELLKKKEEKSENDKEYNNKKRQASMREMMESSKKAGGTGRVSGR